MTWQFFHIPRKSSLLFSPSPPKPSHWTHKNSSKSLSSLARSPSSNQKIFEEPIMDGDKSKTLTNWIPYNTQLEAEKPYKWLSPFFLYRESILEADKDRYFSFELLSQSWELEPESMRAPYVAKSAIRMDELENVKKAQHNKYLEEWLTGDENYDKSVSEESNELVRPATGFLLFLEEFLASANDKSIEEFTEICKNRSLNTVSVIADLTEIWESMSETAKQPYIAKAAEMMAAYDQMLIARIKTMERPTSDNKSGTSQEVGCDG